MPLNMFDMMHMHHRNRRRTAMRTLGWTLACALLSVVGLMIVVGHADERPLMRDVELEALEEAVGWPDPEVATVLTLTGRYIASGRNQDAYLYFQKRAQAAPDRAVFLEVQVR